MSRPQSGTMTKCGGGSSIRKPQNGMMTESGIGSSMRKPQSQSVKVAAV